MTTDTHRHLTPDAADIDDCAHCTPDGWCHYHRGYLRGWVDGTAHMTRRFGRCGDCFGGGLDPVEGLEPCLCESCCGTGRTAQ
ncbi:hypothetical protein FHR81_002022 [Actinoalloteichus hoggarensis]|uniref:Uncharacterized protein n=1 Tax=Actinoalloteichus hoggarensis TaxID=1470176 RepID=A0A221W5Q5_9PSEU|nr:hypothetical protein [Actinoalloteichus hoggarensis]ASO21053.1 hypothetical protein AHOG_17140 [Actinoalloteichus hoggarensis]MBB5920984.1 hypothetical protein [Actinoalloteichus hoggarensis]